MSDDQPEPRPRDPFLLNYKPSELRIASEFLSTWAPFLSKDLCQHCTQTLSDRIRSLDLELDSHAEQEQSEENSNAENSNIPGMSEDHDDNCDSNSIGSWKDGWNGGSEPVVGPSTSGSPWLETPPSQQKKSWADMEEEEEEDEFEEEEDSKTSKRVVDLNAATGELRISKVVVQKPKLSREQREYIRFMNLQRKKDFICLERVKGKFVNILDGLELHTGVFSAAEQKRIVDHVYQLQEMGAKGELKDNRTWSQPVIRGRRPSPRAFHSCTTVGDELFVFGGIDANDHFNDMHIFNTSSHRWRSPRVIGNIPERRKWHSATLYRKSLYIFGGSGRSSDNNDETYYRNVYMFHTARFVWNRIATFGSLPSPRNSHICSYQLDKMIVVGGKDGHGSFCSDVYVMEGLTWRERRTSGHLLPPRAGHAAVNFGAEGTKLYIFGGYTNQILYNDVYVLDIVTGVWTKAITTGGRPSARAFMTGGSLDLQRFVFYGGFNERSEVCDDMYYLHTAYVERFRIRDLYISQEEWQNGHEWFEGELSRCDILNFGFLGELWKEEKTLKETRNRVKAAIDRVKDSISRMKVLRLSRNQFVFRKMYSNIIKKLQKRQNRLVLEKSLLSSALWEVRYEVDVVLDKLKPSEKSVLFINSRSSYEAAIRLRNKYECKAIFHFCCKEGEAKMMGKLVELAHQHKYPYTVSGNMGVMSNGKFYTAYQWTCKLRADEREMERIFEKRAKDERANRNGSGRNKNVKEEEERKEGPSSSHYSYNNH